MLLNQVEGAACDEAENRKHKYKRQNDFQYSSYFQIYFPLSKCENFPEDILSML
jgi:hypothetical protein